MIKITPTTDSGLVHNDYTILLNAMLDIHAARARKTSNTLSGIPVTTLWAKTRVGAFKNITVTISTAQYEILKKIVYHPTVFEWLVIADSDRYNCGVDLTSSKQVYRNGSNSFHECNIGFVIIKVL